MLSKCQKQFHTSKLQLEICFKMLEVCEYSLSNDLFLKSVRRNNNKGRRNTEETKVC